jgi:hypothetical protein
MSLLTVCFAIDADVLLAKQVSAKWIGIRWHGVPD